MNVVQYKEYNYVNQFHCIADKCEASCCGGHHRVYIQHKEVNKFKKSAPELLDYVELGGELGPYIRPKDNQCSLLEDSGLCKVHASKGTDYLSDTCHFFPRVHFRVGKTIKVSAKASCPEVARILLEEDEPFKLVDAEQGRLPDKIQGGDTDAERERRAKYVHDVFVRECSREDYSIEDSLMRMLLVARELDKVDKFDWCDSVEKYFDDVEVSRVKECFVNVPGSISYNVIQLFSERWVVGVKRPELARLMEDIEAGFKGKEKSNKVSIYQNNPQVKKAVDEAVKRYFVYELTRRMHPYSQESNNDGGVFENSLPLVMFVLVFRIAIISRLDDEGIPPTPGEIKPILFSLAQKTEHVMTSFGPFLREKEANTVEYIGLAIYDMCK